MIKIPKKRTHPAQGASWLITFADLMTLLLTFFILLLSFSNIDAQKYKLIANSMAISFGVSWIQGQPPPQIIEVPVDQITVPPPTLDADLDDMTSSMDEVVVDKTKTRIIDPNVESSTNLHYCLIRDGLQVRQNRQEHHLKFEDFGLA